MNNEKIKKVSVLGILSAVATVLMMLQFSVPLMPSFIKFDFSEFPALVAAFVFGPVEGVIVCFAKNMLHLPFTSSGMIGELSNFILGAAFVFTAGIIYKYKQTRGGSVFACILGSMSMALLSYVTNLYITYPAYSRIIAPMDVILGAYQAILPSVQTLEEVLIVFNIPFTLIKGFVVSLICNFTYKKLKFLYDSIGKNQQYSQ